ncbi:MAG: ABC transporter permease [Pirellulales bacterium]|nr:ABC transporter permease [Pirellulales bacterium]
MLLLDNPVLQRELLINLRTLRSFALLLGYNALLGVVVILAWPQESRLNLSNNPESAKNLVNLFFLGQYLLVALMSPSFAAGAITGEKERHTYESLLASPLRPQAIVLGKLFASLAHLAVLLFSSLPIVMLCLPLGGVSLYEVLTVYLGLILSVTLFGMISIACSSFFQRTSSALVVSYLLILPLALFGVGVWNLFGNNGEARLIFTLTIFPLISLGLTAMLFAMTSQRLLHPPDVGSEGKEVIDEERELREAVGMVISRDRFPDSLIAPPKRSQLLPDHANPVYDKELRSEIFAQGTLMLRLVIQISLLLAFPLMAGVLFFVPELSAWYAAYVVLFNMLVGPVFNAGAITSERERETLELLLTTNLSSLQILGGKLFAGFRIAGALTALLFWPFLLAVIFRPYFWQNWQLVLAYPAIIILTCLTTASVALLASVICRKTATSLIVSYLAIVVLFCLPPALQFFAQSFYANTPLVDAVETLSIVSPFSTLFKLPYLATDLKYSLSGSYASFWLYVSFTSALIAGCWIALVMLFEFRWRSGE